MSAKITMDLEIEVAISLCNKVFSIPFQVLEIFKQTLCSLQPLCTSTDKVLIC